MITIRIITGHEAGESGGGITVSANETKEGSTPSNKEGSTPSNKEGSTPSNYVLAWTKRDGETDFVRLPFQAGPVQEEGVNGITHEALLAVILDRLASYQEGRYSCRENALAITKLEEAMHWLHHRTRQRKRRGVEGTRAV